MYTTLSTPIISTINHYNPAILDQVVTLWWPTNYKGLPIRIIL